MVFILTKRTKVSSVMTDGFAGRMVNLSPFLSTVGHLLGSHGGVTACSDWIASQDRKGRNELIDNNGEG